MSRECQLTAHVLCPLCKVICHCVAFCPAAQRIGMTEAAATAPLVTRTQEAALFQRRAWRTISVFITFFLISELLVQTNAAQVSN